MRPSAMPPRKRLRARPALSRESARTGALIIVTSGRKDSMSLIVPVRSARHFGRTRSPVRSVFGCLAPASNTPRSSTCSIAVSAPSGVTSAQAKGRSSGWSGRGRDTQAYVPTTHAGPTSTNSPVTGSPSGSYSTGGNSTPPAAVRTPTSRPSRNSVRNRPMTGPTERVYPPGNASEWSADSNSDRGIAVLPVRVAQAALEELPVGLTRHVFDEVDRLGPLHPGQLAVEGGEDLGGQFRTRRHALGRLCHGLYLLAPPVIGDGEERDRR